MTTEQEPAPEADEQQESGAPVQTVRVPNVRPGAKSGIDHIVIGSDALDPDASMGEEAEEEADTDPMPEGDFDARMAWVREAEDQETASARADKVYDAYRDDDTVTDLGAQLRAAVYGDSGGQGQESDLAADPASEVPGEVVVSQTAGTGPAENVDTGQVTQPGEPLPDAPNQGDGEPLSDQAGDDQGDGSGDADKS